MSKDLESASLAKNMRSTSLIQTTIREDRSPSPRVNERKISLHIQSGTGVGVVKVRSKQPSERGSKRTGTKGCAGEKAHSLPLLPSSISISLSFSSLATAREHS